MPRKRLGVPGTKRGDVHDMSVSQCSRTKQESRASFLLIRNTGDSSGWLAGALIGGGRAKMFVPRTRTDSPQKKSGLPPHVMIG